MLFLFQGFQIPRRKGVVFIEPAEVSEGGGDIAAVVGFARSLAEECAALIVGGMPEVVDTFRREQKFSLVREVQQELLVSYQRDFSKHVPPAALLLEKNQVFGEYKGALTEQYVLQQLLAEFGAEPYYWANESARSEVDFLLESESGAVPLEAKAEQNLRAKL